MATRSRLWLRLAGGLLFGALLAGVLLVVYAAYVEPRELLPPLGRLYPDGLAAAPATYVYTTRGVGQSQLPLRLFCPPQVALLTLRSAEPARPAGR